MSCRVHWEPWSMKSSAHFSRFQSSLIFLQIREICLLGVPVMMGKGQLCPVNPLCKAWVHTPALCTYTRANTHTEHERSTGHLPAGSLTEERTVQCTRTPKQPGFHLIFKALSSFVVWEWQVNDSRPVSASILDNFMAMADFGSWPCTVFKSA